MIRTVLIADEDPGSRLLMSSTLRRWGYLASEVLDGRAVLGEAAKGNIGVIILSCSLPGHNAFQLCRQLRQDSHTAEVPIVLLTPNVDDAVQAQGRQAGIDGYLLKPILLSELVRCVHQYCFSGRALAEV